MTNEMRILVESLVDAAEAQIVTLKAQLIEYNFLLEAEEITGPSTEPCGCGLGDPCDEAIQRHKDSS